MQWPSPDLGNSFYDKAIDEGCDSFKVGRADNEVVVGDLIEMLLSFSCASRDLGIDPVEWPPSAETRLGDLLN